MGGRVGASRTRPAAGRRRPAADPIEHVVLVMMENRPFDQMLGVVPGVDGVDPSRFNEDPQGRRFYQRPSQVWEMEPDPGHELANVERQLAGGNAGFVRDLVAQHGSGVSQAARAAVMGHFAAGDLATLHALARDHRVCDRWFCSVPGPTWTNRLFAMSGTSQGRVAMPDVRPLAGVFHFNLHRYDQTTLFDRLDERDVSWRVYFHDFPLSLLLAHQRRLTHLWRHQRIGAFFDAAAGPAADFPAFAFVEPDYLGGQAADDHPPHDVRRGQAFLGRVFDALVANQELWATTLLVILYDEHGGFYDHVEPPACVAPDRDTYEYDFRRLGPRVPALLVSPWVEPGVTSTTFDHTSLLRYLSDKWGLGALGRRTAEASSLAPLIRRSGSPRAAAPLRLAPPPARRLGLRRAAGDLTAHQRAIVTLAASLEEEPRPALGVRERRLDEERLARLFRESSGDELVALATERALTLTGRGRPGGER